MLTVYYIFLPINMKYVILLHSVSSCKERLYKERLKAISCKKAAPWIFAHYQKIYNFCPILMKLGGNDHLKG